MTLVLVAALVPRVLADDDAVTVDTFQLASPAESAPEQPSPDAAAELGGSEVAASAAPMQNQDAGGGGAADPRVGGDAPQRADAGVVVAQVRPEDHQQTGADQLAQAHPEMSFSVSAALRALKVEQKVGTDLEHYASDFDLGSGGAGISAPGDTMVDGVVVGLDPDLTPNENIGAAIEGILESEAVVEAAAFQAVAFADYARELARMRDLVALRDAAEQADLAAGVAEREVAAAAIMADNIAFQATKLAEVGDPGDAWRARYTAEVAKATVEDLAAKARSARVAAYNASTADVDTGGD